MAVGIVFGNASLVMQQAVDGDPPANFNERAGDINGDGKIDVDDVVGVVNIILG